VVLVLVVVVLVQVVFVTELQKGGLFGKHADR